MRDGWWYASPTDGIEAAPRAEPEDQLDAAPIVLQSTDGETVRTRYGIVKQSATIAGWPSSTETLRL